MSKATMDLHHSIKKPSSIIFTALVAFFGAAIFPVGIVLVLLLSFIDQNIFHFPDIVSQNILVVLAVVGLFAAIYSILCDISKNLEIHKKVIIELIGSNEAIKEHLSGGKN
jgi:hypothetical protein